MKQQISLDELEAKINSVFASPSYKQRISSQEAAVILRVSLRTLRRWERAGLTPERDDPAYYRRQYVKADIEAFAKARKQRSTIKRVAALVKTQTTSKEGLL